MVTEQKVNSLIALAESKFKEAQKAFNKAALSLDKAREIAPLLPDIILEQSWYLFRETETKKWYMETWFLKEDEADALIKQLKIAGVYGIKAKFNSYNKGWTYTGNFIVGEDEIEVKVDGGSKPPQCRIEEIKEFKEVTTYKAICDETGEEVK